LSTSERLELFIKVCQAVQHAHQKGIIHRDIKPTNVLVTLHDGVPVPKVIDFGVAKAINQRLTEKTMFTAFGQFIGTPAYMSPEQAEMSALDVDTRSDIYSLGALLYELLTGYPPFDPDELAQIGFDEMRRTIREREPFKPSTRLTKMVPSDLTTAAKRRQTEPPKLVHLVRGDIDWIVMKCLEKDRTRRYETANGLAMDIKRHLSCEPVLARPPSRLYEFQKTVRRHKFGFAAAAALVTVLAAGVLFSTWQSVRATRAKREAVAAQASEFVQRQKAEANEQKAVAAQANEARLREQAQAEELIARERAYASDMNLAEQALNGHNLGFALDLLNRQRPKPDQQDLRGWEWRHLWQQTRSDTLFTLCQEPSEVHSLAVSPDGRFLAVGTYRQGGLSVWDLRTRRELFRLAKDEEFLTVAFSPTEPVLALAGASYWASGQRRFTLHFFNTATRQMIADLPLDNPCIALAFAQDGKTLATSTLRGQITIWRASDGTKLASYPSEQSAPGPNSAGFAVTRDLHLAAYAMTGGRIRVIDLRDGKELWTDMGTKENSVSTLAFSSDGKILATGANPSESDIRLWDVATGMEIGRLEGHGSGVDSLAFWPDGKTLASSSADQTIRIWDVPSRKCLDVLRGHRNEVWRLVLLPDDKMLVSGAKDGTVCFWDTSVTHSHQSRINFAVENMVDWNFAPDGRSILTLDSQEHLILWTGEDFQRNSQLLEVPANFQSDHFSRDGRFLAVSWTNGVLQVWDTSQRILLHQMTNTPGPVAPQTFLADGKKLITYSVNDNSLHEWDLTAGREIQSWRAPAEFGATSLTPDERECLAISGLKDDSVLRNLVDNSQRQLNLDAPETDFGVFSPDGKLFAISSSMGLARVWNTSGWKPVATLGNFLTGVHGVSFSPDGKRLAIAGHDKEAVRLCDTESWQDVMTLEGPGGIAHVAFSPDGNAVAWGSRNAIVVWRAPSWAEINAAETKENAENGRR
jgi:WD40 repeat protein